MNNPNVLPSPNNRPLKGRDLMIARLGAIAFGLEQGPNASDKNPNFLRNAPEAEPDTPQVDAQ